MTTPLHVLLDPDAVELVADALRRQADTVRRAATRAATEVDAEQRAGKRDIRSQAVTITRLLADAGRLDAAALAVEAAVPGGTIIEAPELAAARQTAPPAPHPLPAPRAVVEAGEAVQAMRVGGGPLVRSPAEALAESAGLLRELGLTVGPDDIDPDLDDAADGATAEDRPTPDELAELGVN